MFDLISYIKKTPGALLIGDPLQLDKPFPNENYDDTTDLIRKEYKKILNRNLEWIFEKAKIYQPDFYKIITSGQFKLAVAATPFNDPFFDKLNYYVALCVVSEKVSFRLEPGIEYFENGILKDPKFPWVKMFNSLPDEITSSYYQRADGMSLIRDEFYLNLYMTGMPGSLTLPQTVLDVSMPKPMKKVAKEKLVAISDKSLQDLDSLGFKILLDTGNEETKSANENSLLIFEAFSTSKRIFVVPEMNFNELRLLSDPIQAMDSYMSQVLLTGSTKFDFTPFSIKA